MKHSNDDKDLIVFSNRMVLARSFERWAYLNGPAFSKEPVNVITWMYETGLLNIDKAKMLIDECERH